MVSARLITVAWLEMFRGRPNIKSAEIKEGIKNQFQVDISLDKAFRARQIALEMLKGRFAYHFERARDYCEELRVSNLGTTAKINLHIPTLHFNRMYVYLAACRIRFLEECRAIISLDVCHLRGFKRQLLVAVGIDGNDRMYPIAFAVCEGETKDSWSWFLELLLADIGLGLLLALATVALEAHTRFCVRHLYANFKKEHKSKLLKDLIWVAARETTRSGFEAKMEMMRNVDVNAYGHLMDIDCAH
ncbi:uncharacterized protein LOC112018962 [Quercus suber]|uniref:uncharacterized protein LOC112018962 n=1 Tax=Quercus suber TaxID=58331 RepID=UPI000CE1AE94|nr:uncharacterized protein LOC112018962 [Quercus suber]